MLDKQQAQPLKPTEIDDLSQGITKDGSHSEANALVVPAMLEY